MCQLTGSMLQVGLLHMHPVIKITVREIHKVVGHGGRESTVAAIRSKCWLPKARSVVNEITRNCLHMI